MKCKSISYENFRNVQMMFGLPDGRAHWHKGLTSFELLEESRNQVGRKARFTLEGKDVKMVLTETCLHYDLPGKVEYLYESEEVSFHVISRFVSELEWGAKESHVEFHSEITDIEVNPELNEVTREYMPLIVHVLVQTWMDDFIRWADFFNFLRYIKEKKDE